MKQTKWHKKNKKKTNWQKKNTNCLDEKQKMTNKRITYRFDAIKNNAHAMVNLQWWYFYFIRTLTQRIYMPTKTYGKKPTQANCNANATLDTAYRNTHTRKRVSEPVIERPFFFTLRVLFWRIASMYGLHTKERSRNIINKCIWCLCAKIKR